MDTKDSADRIVFLDGLRGIAAMSVVVLHVLADPLRAVSPVGGAVADRGFLGVYVFFVISGFAVAHSIARTRMNIANFGRFIARRISRLDPPYWASMVVSVIVAITATAALGREGTAIPSPKVVLMNILYLQSILDVPSIQDVYWTLCFEIQFYLILVTLVSFKEKLEHGISERWAYRLVFGPILLYSVLVTKQSVSAPPGACFRDWYAFFAGVALQRAIRQRDWFTFGLAMCASLVVAYGSPKGATVTIVAAAIVIGNSLGRLGLWLSGRMAQYFGRISYSLYLTHLPVGGRAANLIAHVTGGRPWPRLLAGLIGVAIAIGFADLFWRAIEKPSINLSHSISRRSPRSA